MQLYRAQSFLMCRGSPLKHDQSLFTQQQWHNTLSNIWNADKVKASGYWCNGITNLMAYKGEQKLVSSFSSLILTFFTLFTACLNPSQTTLLLPTCPSLPILPLDSGLTIQAGWVSMSLNENLLVNTCTSEWCTTIVTLIDAIISTQFIYTAKKTEVWDRDWRKTLQKPPW